MSVESEEKSKILPVKPLYGAGLPPLPDGTKVVGDESSCWDLDEFKQKEASKPETNETPQED